MRVLVLSHSYIMRPYRRKFALIAEKPDVTLRVITPARWYESFQEIVFEPDANTRCEEFRALSDFLVTVAASTTGVA